jgi:hypothetical protein
MALAPATTAFDEPRAGGFGGVGFGPEGRAVRVARIAAFHNQRLTRLGRQEQPNGLRLTAWAPVRRGSGKVWVAPRHGLFAHSRAIP